MSRKLERRREIVKLIKSGISIPKISKQLEVNKSTIYYHYRKIKGKKLPVVKIPSNQKVLGEFLGAFSGDGNFYYEKGKWNYTLRIHLHRFDDSQYATYLQKMMQKYFGKKVKIYYIEPNASVLKFHSKRIYELIDDYLVLRPNKSLNVSLKKPIDSLSLDFLRYFVRGVVDTDGSVDNHGRITLGLISENLIRQISKILNQFDIPHRIAVRKTKPEWHDLYVLSINKLPALLYLKEIGFSNKRKERKVR